MKLRLYQIDAFTDKVFGGNPAAVCLLDKWIEPAVMQKIASENNLSETVFILQNNSVFDIKWFTPVTEVDLCGHATLAAAYVLYEYYGYPENRINFHSHRSGKLWAQRNANGSISLDFPKDDIVPINGLPQLNKALGLTPYKTIKGKTDYMLVFNSQDEVEAIRPVFHEMANLGRRGVIVTAKGRHVDFVYRFFAPESGIFEDPVTGSAITSLAPYWSKVLGKEQMVAHQLSDRRGQLWCELKGDRVVITGKAVSYLKGEIQI